MQMWQAVVGVVLLQMVLVACGPTTAELYRRDMARAVEECRRYIGTPLVAAVRECQGMHREIWQRYGATDAFTDAVLSYQLAVYERVERREITFNQAHFLIDDFNRHVRVEREKLQLERARTRAAIEQANAVAAAADAVWWSTFWERWARAYEQPRRPPMLRSPVLCRTDVSGRSALTTCY